jgi:hypothetical protein
VLSAALSASRTHGSVHLRNMSKPWLAGNAELSYAASHKSGGKKRVGPVDPGAERYDALTIFFHWATSAFVVLQFVGAWTIDVFPSGVLRVGVDRRSGYPGSLAGAPRSAICAGYSASSARPGDSAA